MAPLLLCSVLAVAIIVERYFFLKRNTAGHGGDLLDTIKRQLLDNQIEKARQVCRRSESVIGRVLAGGLEKIWEGEVVMEQTMHEAARKELPRMEKHVASLGTIASVSPLLGLLGTVTGMIKVFDVISSKGIGIVQSQAMAGGISEALITTAAGLSVAIPALVAYHYFSHRIDTVTDELDIRISELLSFIRSGGKTDETSGEKTSPRRT